MAKMLKISPSLFPASYDAVNSHAARYNKASAQKATAEWFKGIGFKSGSKSSLQSNSLNQSKIFQKIFYKKFVLFIKKIILSIVMKCPIGLKMLDLPSWPILD